MCVAEAFDPKAFFKRPITRPFSRADVNDVGSELNGLGFSMAYPLEGRTEDGSEGWVFFSFLEPSDKLSKALEKRGFRVLSTWDFSEGSQVVVAKERARVAEAVDARTWFKKARKQRKNLSAIRVKLRRQGFDIVSIDRSHIKGQDAWELVCMTRNAAELKAALEAEGLTVLYGWDYSQGGGCIVDVPRAEAYKNVRRVIRGAGTWYNQRVEGLEGGRNARDTIKRLFQARLPWEEYDWDTFNPDVTDVDELAKWIDFLSNPRTRSMAAIRWFPEEEDNDRTVDLIWRYLQAKRAAMTARLAGDIPAALSFEARCDVIYRGIPDYAAW